MKASVFESTATVFFALALGHSLLAPRLGRLHRLLGEVELIFAFWAAVFVVVAIPLVGGAETLAYLQSLSFKEPVFVFAVMVAAATRPVLDSARAGMEWFARRIPIRGEGRFYLSCLVLGPLLGSFMTEPAAMTVTALVLRERFLSREASEKMKYLTLATLFVNISIGGVLTPFAAPPVLMVAAKWKWDLGYMLAHFGWKAALAVLANGVVATALLRKEFRSEPPSLPRRVRAPVLLTFLHLVALGLLVVFAHYLSAFLFVLLGLLAITRITKTHQDDLRLHAGVMVALFLGGLVVLGGLQRWWIEPLIDQLDALRLFLGSTSLTAIVDNAALTYLGSLVEAPSESFKYALVAGAVAGGGLTLIANAPNPAGFSILRDRFGAGGLSASLLLAYALVPTSIALCFFWFC